MDGFIAPLLRCSNVRRLLPTLAITLVSLLPNHTSYASSTSLMVLGVLFSIQNNVFNITTTAADNDTLHMAPHQGPLLHIPSTSAESQESGFSSGELAAITTTTLAYSHTNSTNFTGKRSFLPIFELVLGAVTYLVGYLYSQHENND